MANSPDLIASYWTLAGNITPFGSNSVSPLPFRARVEAAGRAGYTGFGIYYDDLLANAAQLGYAGMKSILRDNGMRFIELEVVLDWFTDGERRRRSDAVRRDMLHAAEQLGAYQIKIAGDINGDWPVAAMAEPYAHLCSQAADAGTRVSLEILPFANVCDLATGLAVVGDASISNGGLLLDLWHVFRGSIGFAEIARLPLQFLAAVEIDDGPRQCVGTLLEDTIDRRALCGEGDFDVRGFLACLDALGYRGPIGVEILSHEHRQRSLEEAARCSFETARSQFSR